MSFLRTVVSDLVERRLWPVALALLVGVIAVPVVLAGGSTEPSTPAPAGVERAAHASQPVVAIAAPDTGVKKRRGDTRNPFTQRKSRAVASTATADADTSAATGSTGQGTGSATTQPGSGGSSQTTTTPADTVTVKLRFGTTEGELALLANVPRLKPLPSAENPFFVFLGVLEDGKTAVFLISSDATAVGDGTCRPSKDDCQTIELQEDETEFFDVVVEGQTVQYQLDVVDIDVLSTDGSAAAARAAIGRHSEAGAEILRDAHLSGDEDFDGEAGYRWLPDSGLLVRVPAKARTRASSGVVRASSAEEPDAPRGERVWHHEP